MIFIRPTEVTDAIYTGGNLTENDTDDAPLWNSGTAYTVGIQCRRTGTHKVYECLVANTNFVPENNLTGVTPKWLEVGATNMWRIVDEIADDVTTNADLIEIEMTPGLMDSVALINSDGETATCRRIVDAVTVFEETINFALDNVFDWWDYFTEPIIRKTDIVFENIPVYGTGTLEIEVSAPGSTAQIGELVFGLSRDIGELQWKPRVRRRSYSRVVTDDFGRTVITRRRNAKLLTCDLFIPNELFDEINRLMGVYDATPLVWVGDNDYSSLIIFGIYIDFESVLDSPGGSFCNLQLLGVFNG